MAPVKRPLIKVETPRLGMVSYRSSGTYRRPSQRPLQHTSQPHITVPNRLAGTATQMSSRWRPPGLRGRNTVAFPDSGARDALGLPAEPIGDLSSADPQDLQMCLTFFRTRSRGGGRAPYSELDRW